MIIVSAVGAWIETPLAVLHGHETDGRGRRSDERRRTLFRRARAGAMMMLRRVRPSFSGNRATG
ncbi:hypothetical protein LF41_271 [Lysobacter dokdonensis DS-58]|uniref:Uncharacterized protein n=1 Tax=Lysobacter dokdonensis DS-58 TaxID=1300345 RepID=A0A0A2WG31_9GAMM|nr:hypothetical protein LF41_271 [Lysobacter dokdonensis DS-58]